MGYDMGGGSEGSGIHIKHGMAFERFVTASKSECYSEYSQFKNNNQIELKQSLQAFFSIFRNESCPSHIVRDCI
jgi:hypothetical protein